MNAASLHRLIAPEVLLGIRGEVVAPGLMVEEGKKPDMALAPPAPPTELVERLQRACRDTALTVYMVYPGRRWFLGAAGENNVPVAGTVRGKHVAWTQHYPTIVPVLELKKLDGSQVIGREICNLDVQEDVITYCMMASHRLRGRRNVMLDVAGDQLRHVISTRAKDRDEAAQMFSSMPREVRSHIRNNYSDSTRIRAERVADAAKVQRGVDRAHRRAVTPAQSLYDAAVRSKD